MQAPFLRHKQSPDGAAPPGFFLFYAIVTATLFRDAVAKLNLRSGLQVSEEEQHFIADFFAYGITGTVLDWVRGGMRKTPDQLAAQLRHLAADCQKVAVERASGTL